MSLDEYHRKRDFKFTPESSGESPSEKKKSTSLLYVIQKHRAAQLHYYFRLEWNGTPLSRALPRHLGQCRLRHGPRAWSCYPALFHSQNSGQYWHPK